ncbi:ABC transporter ATP-binding protein [bacterium]|nr:ABC transporter ATP-binding protein [bacterium]
MTHLEVSNLRFARGDFSVSVSLSLRKGQTGVILGPSGCGKTTLLRCVAGLERQDEGSLSLGGREIGALPPEKRELGFIFQDLALFDHLTGRQNIAFGMKLRGFPPAVAEARIEALAATLKIEGLLDRRPFAMSGGERQRLAFARAVAPRPALLLMDEPLSSLDAPLRRELRAYLRSSLKAERVTALHVTHDVEEALELGDRVFLMKDGRIISSGTPEEVWNNPPDAWCVRFLGLGALLPPETVRNAGARAAPGDADARRGASLLFVPRSCATLRGTGECEPERGAEAVFRGEVADLLFLGDHRRVLVRLPGAGGTLPSTGPARGGAEADLLAIDADLAFPIAKGEQVGVGIDLARCRLLPADQGGGAAKV